MVAPDVFAHVPPLLCGVLALCAYREKRRFLETGQDTAFGAFPVYVGATLISGFVATALIGEIYANSIKCVSYVHRTLCASDRFGPFRASESDTSDVRVT